MKKVTIAATKQVRNFSQQSLHILGPFGRDSDLRQWGLKLAEHGGKKRKKASHHRHCTKIWQAA
jgi:hypothetical protein